MRRPTVDFSYHTKANSLVASVRLHTHQVFGLPRSRKAAKTGALGLFLAFSRLTEKFSACYYEQRKSPAVLAT